MGFHIEINSILRSDEPYALERGRVHPFGKDGSRIFFDDIPIWLAKGDWTALAEIRVLTQSRTPARSRELPRPARLRRGRSSAPPDGHLPTDVCIGCRSVHLSHDEPRPLRQGDGRWGMGPRIADERRVHPRVVRRPVDPVANKHHDRSDEIRVVCLRADLGPPRNPLGASERQPPLSPHLRPAEHGCRRAVGVGEKGGGRPIRDPHPGRLIGAVGRRGARPSCRVELRHLNFYFFTLEVVLDPPR